MEQKKEQKERIRKAYAPKGERGQKQMTFRIDNENLAWLEQQPNKGRYINQLIAQHRANQEGGETRSELYTGEG